MFSRKVGSAELQLIQGDITQQKDLDAVVNAANAQLLPGGGVAGAIHKAAGSELVRECRSLAPIKAGEAVITRGYQLPNSFIIHCLGPVYGKDKPEDELLAKCYRNAIDIAEEKNLKSMGFPALSTGAFGYPLEEAASIALQTVIDSMPSLNSLKIIRFVLFSKKDYQVHFREIENLIRE